MVLADERDKYLPPVANVLIITKFSLYAFTIQGHDDISRWMREILSRFFLISFSVIFWEKSLWLILNPQSCAIVKRCQDSNVPKY